MDISANTVRFGQGEVAEHEESVGLVGNHLSHGIGRISNPGPI
jgi:hypothetical protein